MFLSRKRTLFLSDRPWAVHLVPRALLKVKIMADAHWLAKSLNEWIAQSGMSVAASSAIPLASCLLRSKSLAPQAVRLLVPILNRITTSETFA